MFIIKSISEYLQELSELKVNELLNVICFIITIIAAVYSTWLFSTSQFKKIRYKKEERFLTRYKRISKLSGEFTNKMFNHYLKKYNSELAGKTEDEKENSGLIIHKDWEINFDGLELDRINVIGNNGTANIEEAELNLSRYEKLRNRRIRRKLRKRYPQKKNGYALNIIQYVEGKNLFNGDCFAVADIKKTEDNKSIDLVVYKTDYFSFVDSCKALEFKYSVKKQRRKPDIDIFDFTNRSATIGVNCLTLFPNITVISKKGIKEKKNFLILHKRNSAVMESPNTFHVVPAGSFQPIKTMNKKEVSNEFNKNLSNTVYREFCEEILHTNHMSELVSIDLITSSDDYIKTKDNSKIYYLGVGLEPFNTKVEVLALMVYKFNKETSLDELKNFLKIGGSADDKENEGKIIIEEYTKPVIEQYWGTTNITPSSKEIFKKVYENYDKINKLL